MKILTAVVVGTVVAMTVPAWAEFKLEGEPKVAYLFHGAHDNAGWGESHNNARLKMEEALGMKIAYAENIPEETTKVRQAIDLFVNRGHNIIIGTSYGYGDAFLEAAKEYPNVAFLNAAGDTNHDNLESFYARTYEGWYLGGMLAGAMTETDKAGIIAGFPLSLVNWDINGFAQGVRATNPDATTSAIFVNTWYDPVIETQMTEAILEQDVDVVATDNSTAPVVTAERRGKMSVGYQVDMSPHGPKGNLTSVLFHWEHHLIPTIQAIENGTWEPNPYGAFVGIKEGVIGLAPINESVPADVVERVKAAEAAIRAGEMTPFDGPLKNQKGEMILEEGASLDDGQLWSMNYFVEGVIGTMPSGD